MNIGFVKKKTVSKKKLLKYFIDYGHFKNIILTNFFRIGAIVLNFNITVIEYQDVSALVIVNNISTKV